MTDFQKLIKYLAMGLAVLLAVSIIGGIVAAVGIFGGFLFGDGATGEMERYPLSGAVTSLDIQVRAAELTIEQGDTFAVESNIEGLKVKEKDGELKIEEPKRLFHGDDGAVLTITVPADTQFQQVQIDTGAGRLTVEALSARELELDLGAGAVRIGDLVVSEQAQIEGGAGQITIDQGAIRDLDLDMGVGKLTLTAALTGRCDLDLGVGETELTLLGTREDYTLDLEKGLGTIRVDGESVSDDGDLGNGPARVQISGGVGQIYVRFQDPDAQ